MSTCNRLLDLQTLVSRTVMPKNLLDHWFQLTLNGPRHAYTKDVPTAATQKIRCGMPHQLTKTRHSVKVRVGRVPSTWPILLRCCIQDLCRHARQQPQQNHGAWFWKYPALAWTFASSLSRPLFHLLTLTSCLLFVDESLRIGFLSPFRAASTLIAIPPCRRPC